VIINGLSNLYSAVSELFIHVPKTVQQGAQVSVKSLLRDSKEALRVILSDKFLRLFVPCALLLNLLAAGPLTLILPFCMEKGFTVDMYGYLMTIWAAGFLICVLVLGVVKLKPRMRFGVLAVGFISSVLFFCLAYISKQFIPLCIMAFLASFANCAGNTIFNASLMLALPEENRGAILGFIQSASVGGTALSAVIYGVLGDVLPLYLVFTVGNLLSAVPMLYLCFSPRTKEFVLEH
jgi:MFS family permease